MADNAATGTVIVAGKSQFVSRTNIVNTVMVVEQICELVTGMHVIPEPWGMLSMGIVNIILRQFTVGPVGKNAVVKGELVGLTVPGDPQSAPTGQTEPIRTT